MTDELLPAAEAACASYWQGSDKSRLNLRDAMTTLRCAVEAERKRMAKDDTQRLEKPK